MITPLGPKRFIAKNIDAYSIVPGKRSQIDAIVYDVADITHEFIKYYMTNEFGDEGKAVAFRSKTFPFTDIDFSIKLDIHKTVLDNNNIELTFALSNMESVFGDTFSYKFRVVVQDNLDLDSVRRLKSVNAAR